MDDITETEEFLYHALLCPNMVTSIPEILDMMPVIDNYYSYLVAKETYNIPKHFDLIIYEAEIHEFEKCEDMFVNNYMNQHKYDHRHLSKDSVYSLILDSAINLDKMEVVNNILSASYEENILTYTNKMGYSPISTVLLSGNVVALNFVKAYISRNSEYIIKSNSMGDNGHISIAMEFCQFRDINAYELYKDYLVPLYSEKVLTDIKEYTEECARTWYTY